MIAWSRCSRPWRKHNGCLDTMGSKCLCSFACSHITQVFLFCFPTSTGPGHRLCARSVATGMLFSISLIDMGCKGSEERIASVCLMKWLIPFYVYFKVDPFIFTVPSYWSSRGGMLAGGPLISEWETTSKNCRLEKGIELPYSIQLPNFAQ